MAGTDYEILWSDLTTGDYLAIALFLAIATAPYVVAAKQQTSLALATVLSLLLVTFYQMLLEQGLFDFEPRTFLSLIPALASEPTQAHRFITAAWLHSGWIHVRENSIGDTLEVVPLMQRKRPSRWWANYIIGLLCGNIA